MATQIDLRRLLAKDQRLTSIFLTFSSRLEKDEFRKALLANTTLEDVVITADDSFFLDYMDDRYKDVLKVLGRLPRLTKLSINSHAHCQGIVSMKALCHLLEGARDLRSLSISGLKLTGSAQDFDTFSRLVQQMFFLSTFRLVQCNAVLEEARLNPSPLESLTEMDCQKIQASKSISGSSCQGLFDSLMMSLSILPSLQAIQLEPKDQGGFGTVSVSAATSLCLSASVRLLRIRNLDLSDAHVTSMASVLERNGNLQVLDLGSMTDFQSSAAHAMGQMLRTNTTLMRLELGMDRTLRDDCAETIAQALRQNQTLRSFVVVARNPSALKQLRLSYKARKAMLEMLPHNYSLSRLFLFRKAPLARQFKLYSSLNQVGRGELLRSPNANRPEEWIQKLAAVKDDLNSIFYFVSNNPTLCSAPMVAPKRKSATIRENDDAAGTPSPSKKQRILY